MANRQDERGFFRGDTGEWIDSRREGRNRDEGARVHGYDEPRYFNRDDDMRRGYDEPRYFNRDEPRREGGYFEPRHFNRNEDMGGSA